MKIEILIAYATRGKIGSILVYGDCVKRIATFVMWSKMFGDIYVKIKKKKENNGDSGLKN